MVLCALILSVPMIYFGVQLSANSITTPIGIILLCLGIMLGLVSVSIGSVLLYFIGVNSNAEWKIKLYEDSGWDLSQEILEIREAISKREICKRWLYFGGKRL